LIIIFLHQHFFFFVFWIGTLQWSLSLVKLVLPASLSKRIHVLQTAELQQLIEPEFLLEEYGGKLKEDWKQDKETLLNADKKMIRARNKRMQNVEK
jgi:hypothetical protein